MCSRARPAPGVAGDEVDDAAGDRVADEGPIEEREHHAEERDALLGVEAAVDGVDQHEGVIGAEPSVACLFGKDGEPLTAGRQRVELRKHIGLRGAVELHGAVAAGTDGKLRPSGLGAREGQDRFAHA